MVIIIILSALLLGLIGTLLFLAGAGKMNKEYAEAFEKQFGDKR
jgi:hypothetical protein